MLKLFISYRRADTRKDAARLYDRLVPVFGKDNVFKDVDTLAPGVDFREEIVSSITQCDAVLVLIGTQWLTIKDERGLRRLDHATDWVRIELECALSNDRVRVIPLLVDNAPMPHHVVLPESIRKLAYKQSRPLRDDPDFHKDVDRLIEELLQFNSSKTSTATIPSAVTEPVGFNVHRAIQHYFKAFNARQWEDARATLATIRASGRVPHVVEIDKLERELWDAIDADEAEHDYDIIRVMFQHASKSHVWNALQRLWEVHPNFDPDKLADKVRPAAAPPPRSGSIALVAPFEWCRIPAGLVTLEDASDFGGTRGGDYYLPPFLIGKYPITAAQYAQFVNAPDGYRNLQWWTYSTEAMSWRAQHPTATRTPFTGDLLPRTNVSWFDAIAFCRWLSAKTGHTITLPTEQQWQRAAQGDDHRRYPTGNDLDKTSLHFTGTLLGQPTPVDQYPTGASPFGVMDTCGNVWEWCLTVWDAAHPPDEVPLTGRAKRSVRGGSWGVNSESLLQVTFRNRMEPDTEGYHLGFRCVQLID
ncbi:MAG: SUMF1/EgtB/PvdO family nonheme iron enzyme [Anaerolineae bacterium]|nr:SUMF1/EgtB/PvdO family nonheme iron enzyme [Anaerolineae bacterium]